MGGYVAFAGGMMAALWRRPLVVHEPGAVAGITNRVLAPVADRVVVGMQDAFQRRLAQRWTRLLPAPRRIDWLGTRCARRSPRWRQPEARYAGRSGPLRLLVVGGSLGAQTMNDLVLAAVASMPPDERPQIVHQAGAKLYEGLRVAYETAGVQGEVLPFIADMARRYAWCDVLVCRSGAITVAEITAAGVAAILFPLPWFVADAAGGERALPRRPRGGHRPGAARDHARGARRGCCARSRARASRRWRATRARWAVRTLRAAAPTCARSLPMRHKVKRIHFVGIGGSGMSRHRGGVRATWATP